MAERAAGETAADELVADLYEHHHRTLVRLAGLLLGDTGAAEEVVQEAYVRVYLAAGRLREPAAAAGYLRTTVVNLARSQLRRRSVALRRVGEPPADVASAETAAITADDRRAVMDAIRDLPLRQREVVVLRYWAELSETEIAATLGVSQSSVKTHVQRAMATLAGRLEERR